MDHLFLRIKQIYPDIQPFTDVELQNDGNGDYIKKWNYSEPQPDDATLAAVDLTKYLATQECYKNRRRAYGPVSDQLDEIYKDINAWKTRIAAVKAQFPKPQ